MFWQQIWCLLSNYFFLKICIVFDENELASKFLSFFHQFLTLMCVWYLFQTEEALFIALGMTFTLCINDKLSHLMTILLCFGFIVGQGRTQGRVLGLNPSLNLIYYENFVTCAKETNCFRILFAFQFVDLMQMPRNVFACKFQGHCNWAKM